MNTLSSPEAWLEQHGDALFRFALVRVRDEPLAEDLVQETLLAALKARHDFAQRSAERTWLIGILKHKIVDALRKSSRESTQEIDLDDYQASHFDEQGHWRVNLTAWSSPEKALEQQEFWRVLNDCIDTMPPRLARIFVLREVEGMQSAEICKVEGISTTNNLWVMLSRMRMRLRQCLEKRWFDRQEEGET